MQNFYPKLYCYINDYNLPELLKLRNNINIIYRNYDKQNDLDTIVKLRDFCKKTKRKLFISNSLKLALNLKLDGIYIPSFNKRLNYVIFIKPKKFSIIGSAHNIKEIIIKEKQGCEEIFISSIFKNKKTKILESSNLICLLLYPKKIIALGGINNKTKHLKSTNSIGFSSISWAKKNGLWELRPFLINLYSK